MSDIVLERISQVLCDRLDTITVDNDYPFDIAEVVRPGRDDAVLDDLFGVVSQAEATSRIIPGNPPVIEWDQTFEIDLVRRPSDTDETSADKLLNEFAGAAVHAVSQPSSNWHNFDGLSLNANWGTPSPIEGDGVLVGRTLRLIVTYRTEENDPSALAF